MTGSEETKLRDLLGRAQATMVELSGQYASTKRDWDKAKAFLDGAKQLAAVAELISSDTPPPVNRSLKLPYYYVEGDKLVKVGPSRKGGTYEHRVTRGHYDVIVANLSDCGRRENWFDTRELVASCSVPQHEPLVVVNMLEDQKVLKKLRRGSWQFACNPLAVAKAADQAWDRLPRH